eukprot:maker-scaffold_18-snap-gene-3.2-mRNA-1 protein AED:0.00 eAED:0.00 QI:342/1/1/1/1/1/2/96/400
MSNNPHAPEPSLIRLPDNKEASLLVTEVIAKAGSELKLSSDEYKLGQFCAVKILDSFQDDLQSLQSSVETMKQAINSTKIKANPPFTPFLPYVPFPNPPIQNVYLPPNVLPEMHQGAGKRHLNPILSNQMKRKTESPSHIASVGNPLHTPKRQRSSKWSQEQDDALRIAVKKWDGRNWKAIAELVPGRDHVQCLQRWKKVLRPGLVKGHWSAEEDKKLLELIQDEKMHSWAMVASQITGRTAKQCRERWSLNLDPSINRSPWKPEEDELLLRLFESMGGKWSEIKTHFNGRTENAVKTRYKSLARAKAREWTQDQDRKLIELRLKYGKDWNRIKAEMPGRSRNAIKVRCKTLEYEGQVAQVENMEPEAVRAVSQPDFPEVGKIEESKEVDVGGVGADSMV